MNARRPRAAAIALAALLELVFARSSSAAHAPPSAWAHASARQQAAAAGSTPTPLDDAEWTWLCDTCLSQDAERVRAGGAAIEAAWASILATDARPPREQLARALYVGFALESLASTRASRAARLAWITRHARAGRDELAHERDELRAARAALPAQRAADIERIAAALAELDTAIAVLGSYGASAAHELALDERARGEIDAGIARLAAAFDAWPEAGGARALCGWDLVDTLRAQQRWAELDSWMRRVQQLEQPALDVGVATHAALVESRVALDLGCLERGAAALQRARALTTPEPHDVALEHGSWLLQSDQHESCVERMSALIAELDAANLDAEHAARGAAARNEAGVRDDSRVDEPSSAHDPSTAHDVPRARDDAAREDAPPTADPLDALRAQALLRRGLAQATLAAHDARRAELARADLRAALPHLPAEQRVLADVALAELALRAGDIGAAELACVDADSALRELAAQPAAPQHAWALETGRRDALRSRIARLRGAPRAQLLEHEVALRADWAALLERWDRLPPREGGVGFLHADPRRSVLVELCELLIASHGDDGVREGLALVCGAHERGSLARSLGARTPELAATLELLPPRGLLLVFVPGSARTLLWSVDRASVRCDALAGADELHADLQEYRALIGTPPDDADPAWRAARLAKLGARLARSLFTPELRAELARGRALCVVGLDWFGDVPIEALPLEVDARDGAARRDDDTIGTRCAISCWPSVPVAHALATRALARRAALSLDLLVFAAPALPSAVGASGFAPLALDARAADELTRAFEAPRVRVYTGDAASETRLRHTPLDATRFLHVHAHGWSDATRARPQALVLASDADADGLLWADEIEPLRAPPCVLLGSCTATRGHLRVGEDGLGHLGGAWMAAGAECVIGSSYVLGDAATLALCGAFYRASERGADCAEALRAARVELRALERWRDPFHWALLRVHGVGAAAMASAATPAPSSDDRGAAAR